LYLLLHTQQGVSSVLSFVRCDLDAIFPLPDLVDLLQTLVLADVAEGVSSVLSFVRCDLDAIFPLPDLVDLLQTLVLADVAVVKAAHTHQHQGMYHLKVYNLFIGIRQ